MVINPNFWEKFKKKIKKPSLKVGSWFKREKELAPETMKQWLGTGERESQFLKGAVKAPARGLVKGVSLGYVEPEFLKAKTEEEKERYKFAEMAGEFGGWLAPFSGVTKGIGLGIKGASKIPMLAKVGAKVGPKLAGRMAKEGAAFGLISGLEKPEEDVSRKEAATFGAAFGAAFPLAGAGLKIVKKPVSKALKKAEVFEGLKKLTTKTLEKLKGKTTVSKQYISDLSNAPELKQSERDLIRNTLKEYPEGKIPVKEFAEKAEMKLLPLEVRMGVKKIGGMTDARMGIRHDRYENIILPPELRGNIASYNERIYESPIKTSAGGIHFDEKSVPNYFAHTRIENLDNVITTFPKKYPYGYTKGGTRRVIEIQSDLFQKGGLEKEFQKPNIEDYRKLGKDYFISRESVEKILGRKKARLRSDHWHKAKSGDRESNRIIDKIDEEYKAIVSDKGKLQKRISEMDKEYEIATAKFQPYRNTWHERIIREEIKKATKDGKTKLQFPTGETAMKVEGLGEAESWELLTREGKKILGEGSMPKSENLKIGNVIRRTLGDDLLRENDWIITDILGEGKFKAVRKQNWENWSKYKRGEYPAVSKDLKVERKLLESAKETFDISGRIDTSNPIYRFYEKEVQKYLKRIRPDMKRVTDKQGVTWFETKLKPEDARAPMEAYGAIAGIEYDEETGKWKMSPEKTALGMLGIGALRKSIGKKPVKTMGEVFKPKVKIPRSIKAIIKAEAEVLQEMEIGRLGGLNIRKMGEEGYIKATEHSPAYRAFYKEFKRRPVSMADWEKIAERELDAGRSSIGQSEAFRALKGAKKAAPMEEINVEDIFKEVEKKSLTAIEKGKMERMGKASLISEAEKKEFLKTLSSDIQAGIEKGRGLTPREGKIVARRFEEYIKTSGMKERMITMAESKLLKARIRAEARGAKAGAKLGTRLTRQEMISRFKDSRTTIRESQKNVMNYIKDNLPAEARGKFIESLKSDLTKRKSVKVFERVEREKEKIIRQKIIHEVKELSVPKGTIAVDYQKKIEDTTRDLDFVKPTEKTLKKLKGLRDYIKQEGMPLNIQSKYIEKMERLTKKNVRDMSTGELRELKSTIEHLQSLGKLKEELKYKYNARERKFAIEKLLNSTKNADPKVSGNQTRADLYKVETKRIYMDTLHTPRVADMLDGYQGYGGENAKYIKSLAKRETDAKSQTQTIVSNALEKIQKLGIKELTEKQQAKIMINIRYREGAFDQTKTLMVEHGYKEIPKLTEQEIKIIQILKQNTNRDTNKIAAIYEEIENKPFRKLKEYILPIKYEKELNLIPSQTIEQSRYRTTQAFKGFSYARQKGVKKMPRTDILGIFEEAINEQQWYKHLQPELENIKYLVKGSEYLNKAGEMATDWWKNQLDITARRGWSATARSSPLLRQTRLNLNNAILGYKVSSIMMQPFAIFDALAYTQSHYGTMASLKVLEEFSKAWIIPKYAKKFIETSPALQLRKGGELAIEETLQKVGKAKGAWQSYVKGGLSLLQKADVKTAAGIEKGLLDILKKQGTKEAKTEAEFLMNLVSGSAEIVHRPHILSTGEAARTWFTFQTFFLNRWGIMAHDLIRSGLIASPEWKKKFSALIGLGIFLAGSIAEEKARKEVWEGITDKKLPETSTAKIALMAIPKNIPYFGNLIEMADRGGDADPPLIRTLENISKGSYSAIAGKTPEQKVKGAMRATEAGISIGVGFPGTAQFFDLLERIFLGGEKSKIPSGVMPKGMMPKMPSMKMGDMFQGQEMPSLKMNY